MLISAIRQNSPKTQNQLTDCQLQRKIKKNQKRRIQDQNNWRRREFRKSLK